MKQQTSATTETGDKFRKIVSFTGKTVFMGIDVHKKDWRVAVHHQGIVLGNQRMKADSQQLIEHLSKRSRGASFKCVYESSAIGISLSLYLKIKNAF